MTLPESLIQQFASFCKNNGYRSICGSFTTDMEVPDGFDSISTEVEILIAVDGNFLIWHEDPLTGTVRGSFGDGREGINRICMGPSVDEQSKVAVWNSLVDQIGLGDESD